MKRDYTAATLLIALVLFGTSIIPASAVSLPNGTAIFETSLVSRISASDTSMTLVTNSANGETVNGFDCFTIDEGRSDAEFVCGTVSGTSVTGLERGISYANGTTTSSSRAHVHRVGANVKKTDFPLIQRARNILNATEAIPNTLFYASEPSSAQWSAATGTTLVTLNKLIGTAFGSSPLGVSVGGTGVDTLPALLLQGNGTNPVTGTTSPSVAAIYATSTTATSTFAGPTNFSGPATTTFAGLTQFSATSTVATSTVASSTVKYLNVENINVSGTYTGVTNSWYLITSTTTTAAMGVATTTIVGTPPDMRIVIHIPSAISGGATNYNFLFNGDGGANYYGAYTSFFGSTDTSLQNAASQLSLVGQNTATSSPGLIDVRLKNILASVKEVMWNASLHSSATAAPGMIMGSGIWNNTSAAISTFQLRAGNGLTSTFPIGTTIRVYGSAN